MEPSKSETTHTRIMTPEESDELDQPIRSREDPTTKVMKNTIPQMQQQADELRTYMEQGQLPEGNVELAAILGYRPAQIALDRKPDRGMQIGDLIKFLLNDPLLQITIKIAGE